MCVQLLQNLKLFLKLNKSQARLTKSKIINYTQAYHNETVEVKDKMSQSYI